HVVDNRVGRRPCATHESGPPAPWDNRPACVRGETDDRGDVPRAARPDDGGRINASFWERGPAVGAEGIEPVAGWDRRARCDLVRAEMARELRECLTHANGNAVALFNSRGASRPHQVVQGVRVAARCGVAVVLQAPGDPGVRELTHIWLVAL